MRLIGIEETCRSIISKAIVAIVGQDIVHVAGPLQLCADYDGGCEVAIQSIRQLFSDFETEVTF